MILNLEFDILLLILENLAIQDLNNVFSSCKSLYETSKLEKIQVLKRIKRYGQDYAFVKTWYENPNFITLDTIEEFMFFKAKFPKYVLGLVMKSQRDELKGIILALGYRLYSQDVSECNDDSEFIDLIRNFDQEDMRKVKDFLSNKYLIESDQDEIWEKIAEIFILDSGLGEGVLNSIHAPEEIKTLKILKNLILKDNDNYKLEEFIHKFRISATVFAELCQIYDSISESLFESLKNSCSDLDTGFEIFLSESFEKCTISGLETADSLIYKYNISQKIVEKALLVDGHTQILTKNAVFNNGLLPRLWQFILGHFGHDCILIQYCMSDLVIVGLSDSNLEQKSQICISINDSINALVDAGVTPSPYIFGNLCIHILKSEIISHHHIYFMCQVESYLFNSCNLPTETVKEELFDWLAGFYKHLLFSPDWQNLSGWRSLYSPKISHLFKFRGCVQSLANILENKLFRIPRDPEDDSSDSGSMDDGDDPVQGTRGGDFLFHHWLSFIQGE